ncbi:MAG: DCC1-like thiol-disulfide oxidoreductase family protein [Fuerstiella sp.]
MATAVAPHPSIVFFDGVCGLCNHTVNFLLARDQQAVLKFAPLQGETAAQLVPDQVRKNLNTFVFAHAGRLYYRSGAMARILMQLSGGWRILGALLWVIPWPLRDLGYRMVAALRYRLFGKSEACRLPTPEERSRFLD